MQRFAPYRCGEIKTNKLHVQFKTDTNKSKVDARLASLGPAPELEDGFENIVYPELLPRSDWSRRG